MRYVIEIEIAGEVEATSATHAQVWADELVTEIDKRLAGIDFEDIFITVSDVYEWED
jgi:hypothetical protein